MQCRQEYEYPWPMGPEVQLVIHFLGKYMSTVGIGFRTSALKYLVAAWAGLSGLIMPSVAVSQELDLIEATEITARAILKRAERLPHSFLKYYLGTQVPRFLADAVMTQVMQRYWVILLRLSNTIVLEPNQLEGLRRAFGDGAVAYAIAHEVGHWVQATFVDPKFDARGAKRELQADCIAGILLYGVSNEIGFTAQDAREAINAAYSIGSKSHGAPYERAYALQSGFSGDPDECYPTN